MTNISSNFSLVSIMNVTTPVELLSLNDFLDQLGFETWRTIINTFILPPVNFIGIIFCSFSLWIFLRSSFSDPIFFYYKLLCFINILHLLHNIPYGILVSPFYFPWVDTYAVCFYRVYYAFMSTFLFHYEDVIQMGILLHKMKQFSPFVRNHFRASPQFISFAFFLTCLLIDSPLLSIFEISFIGDFYYIDSNDVKQTNTLYFNLFSDFSQTFFRTNSYRIYFIFSKFVSFSFSWCHIEHFLLHQIQISCK
jgi:hypothetical protein